MSAPPFRLPGTHFAGVLVWLVVGGMGLVAIAPELAEAQFLSPRVFAVTHLYTIGFIVCLYCRRRDGGRSSSRSAASRGTCCRIAGA